MTISRSDLSEKRAIAGRKGGLAPRRASAPFVRGLANSSADTRKKVSAAGVAAKRKYAKTFELVEQMQAQSDHISHE